MNLKEQNDFQLKKVPSKNLQELLKTLDLHINQIYLAVKETVLPTKKYYQNII